MGLFRAFASLFSGLPKREPSEDSWVLPGNEVTRAIESGRDLAAYTAPAEVAPVERLQLPPITTFDLPPLELAPPRIVISDDIVHGGPEVPALEATEKPLEPKVAKKRWWRRAA